MTTTIKGIEVTFAICSDYQSEAVIRAISRSPVPYQSGWSTRMAEGPRAA